MKTRALAHYNMGNVYNMQGDRLAGEGKQEAMDKFRAARDSYIKALDLREKDADAKWNLQLTQMKIKKFEEQQKQQQKNQDKNKDKKNKDKNKQQDKNNQNKQDQQDKKNQKDKQDQKQQDKKKEDKKNQDKQQNPKERNKKEEKPQPKPEKSEKEMKKEDAGRWLRHYADDEKELNKPPMKMRGVKGKKPEKDW
jgi:hypothetical protein